MRTLAILLYQLGRLQTIIGLVVMIHVFLLWRWWNHPLKYRYALRWLIIFFAGSLLVPGLAMWLLRANHGNGYVDVHLYRSMWSGEQMLALLLDRWQNLLLPIYLPWIGIWLGGLFLIGLIALWLDGNSQKAVPDGVEVFDKK